MPDTTIRLGGTDYTIRPLTLKQLRGVLPAFGRAGGLDAEASIDAAIDVVLAALARDYATVTRDMLLDTETSVAEFGTAVATIAKLSGLITAEPVKPGEQQAAAPTG